MPFEKILLLIGFAIISAVWYTKMPYNIGTFYKKIFSRRTPALSLIFVVVLLVGLSLEVTQFPVSIYDPFIVLFGLAIYYAGIALAVWGRISMGTSWGVPAQHDITSQKKLITEGAFHISRNPIYTGLLLMFVGFGFTLRSYLFLLAIPIGFFVHHLVIKEEKLLKKHFGKQWTDYTKKVRRYL